MIFKLVKSAYEQVLDLLYPPFCALCDASLVHGSKEALCEECQIAYPILEEDLCVICGKPLQDNSKERCLDCRRRVHFFEEGRALWTYEDRVKEAVKSYKYHNRREIGLLFAKVLARVYNDGIDWPIDLVVGVPLHPKKERERGFSQTKLLAEGFTKSTGLALGSSGVLRRHRVTQAQEGLSDKERLANVINAFSSTRDLVEGKTILLLDDVYTTGATLDGCAKALVDAGATNVYFMTVAIGRGY